MKKFPAIFAAVFLVGCTSSTVTEGLLVEIKATPDAPGATMTVSGAMAAEGEAQTKGFRTAEGRYVELQRGLLNLVPVELVRCASVWQRLDPLASAYAHGGHDGAAPAGVVDVNRPDGTEFDLGSLAPAPGSYCGLRLQLQTVRANPPGSNIDMLGASAYVAPCRYQDLGIPTIPGAPVDPASAFEEGCLEAVKLSGGIGVFTVTVDPPLTMSASERLGRLHLHIAYDRWFDGVDLAALESSIEQQAQVLANMRGSVRASGR